jgi:hypothetical protein
LSLSAASILSQSLTRGSCNPIPLSALPNSYQARHRSSTIHPDSTAPLAFFLEQPTDEYGAFEYRPPLSSTNTAHIQDTISPSPTQKQTHATAVLPETTRQKRLQRRAHHQIRVRPPPYRDIPRPRFHRCCALVAAIRSPPRHWSRADAGRDAATATLAAKRFLMWWALTGLDAYPEAIARASAEIMKMQTQWPSETLLPLIMEFCTLVARKGYLFALRYTRMLAYVFRYEDPRVTTGFLGRVERAAKAKTDKASNMDWLWVRSLAVRVYFSSGRKDIAKRLYQQGLTSSHLFDPPLSQKLLQHSLVPIRDTSRFSTPTPPSIPTTTSIPTVTTALLKIIDQFKPNRSNFETFLGRFILASLARHPSHPFPSQTHFGVPPNSSLVAKRTYLPLFSHQTFTMYIITI